MNRFFQLLCLIAFIPAAWPEAVISPSSFFLDKNLSEDHRFSAEIHIYNDDEKPLNLSILSGESDWTVSPGKVALKPGETIIITVEGPFPDEAPGPLIFLSDREDLPGYYTFQIDGTTGSENPEDPARDLNTAGYFFYTPGCSVCEKFFQDLLPQLAETYHLALFPEKRNVYDPGNFELMDTLLNERGGRTGSFPVMVWGDAVFTGEKGLFQDFPAYLEDPESYQSETLNNLSVKTREEKREGVYWITVFLAGLLDGINPCAFTTLIFLISYLRLLGRKGRDILKIGGSFTFSVFLSYFLMGLGMFQALRLADSFQLVSSLLRWLMVLMLLFLSVLSFLDYRKVKKGSPEDSLLQLSDDTKKRIHRVVRKSSRSSMLILSSITAGFLISLYELGCTGQIYLPMIVYMVKTHPALRTVCPLLLYNTGFILPLGLVFFLFYKGSDSETFALIFRRHLGKIRIITSLFFLCLALFLIFR